MDDAGLAVGELGEPVLELVEPGFWPMHVAHPGVVVAAGAALIFFDSHVLIAVGKITQSAQLALANLEVTARFGLVVPNRVLAFASLAGVLTGASLAVGLPLGAPF